MLNKSVNKDRENSRFDLNFAVTVVGLVVEVEQRADEALDAPLDVVEEQHLEGLH